MPISAAHLGYAVSAFSARLLKHMKTLGAEYNAEEHDSFMAVWRYTGYLMGIPETILFHDATEALKLYEVGLMCEPIAQIESVVMAHSLVNSAPLIAGMVEPADPPQSGPIRVPDFPGPYWGQYSRFTDVSSHWLLRSGNVVQDAAAL